MSEHTAVIKKNLSALVPLVKINIKNKKKNGS